MSGETSVLQPIGARKSQEVIVKGVSKRFGATNALSDISLDFEPGIHALLGANGAGKSTLLGIIAGRLRPSSGQVFVGGSELPYGRPRTIARSGVAAIYQELSIVPAMTAIENVFLSGERGGYSSRLRSRDARKRFFELAERVGADVSPESPAGSLSVPDQQLLEIMRCLNKETSVVLLDEPTSALAEAERLRLFGIMRELSSEGKVLIFVSHELDEVLQIADRICVFQNGQLVADKETREWQKATLIQAMLGDTYTAYTKGREEKKAIAREGAKSVAELRTVRVRPGAPNVSFSIHEGEVVGLAGLAGSGRSSLIRAIAGDSPGASGSLVIDGAKHMMPRSPRAARRVGVGLVPEDRKRSGLVMGMTSRENVVLPKYAEKRNQVRLAKLGRDVNATAGLVGLSPAFLDRPAAALSGGNQQKLLLARWAQSEIRLLVADEPTRGVDVGAKLDVLKTLRRLAERGMAVLIVSSELEDLDELCDRVLVMRKGAVTAQLSRAAGEISVDAMLSLSFE